MPNSKSDNGGLGEFLRDEIKSYDILNHQRNVFQFYIHYLLQILSSHLLNND